MMVVPCCFGVGLVAVWVPLLVGIGVAFLAVEGPHRFWVSLPLASAGGIVVVSSWLGIGALGVLLGPVAGFAHLWAAIAVAARVADNRRPESVDSPSNSPQEPASRDETNRES